MVDQWEPVSRDSVKTPLEVSSLEQLSYLGVGNEKTSIFLQYSQYYSTFYLFFMQVYEELQVQGYLVDYERVPITDEKPPKELDFDILVSFNHSLSNSSYTKF